MTEQDRAISSHVLNVLKSMKNMGQMASAQRFAERHQVSHGEQEALGIRRSSQGSKLNDPPVR